MRKVLEMALEYRLPQLGFVENQQNGLTGEAGLPAGDLLRSAPASADTTVPRFTDVDG